MFYFTLATLVLALRISALPYEILEPGSLALELNEDEFEDYLDSWLAVEERSWINSSSRFQKRSGCNIQVNGHLGQPQPVFIRSSTNSYLDVYGNSGAINLEPGEEILVACPGRNIVHPFVSSVLQTANVQCVHEAIVSGVGWMYGMSFEYLTCSSNAYFEAIATYETCYNDSIVIRTGYIVKDVFYPLFSSCFDQKRYEVLYVEYSQDNTNAIHQTGVSRPGWRDGGFFGGININTVYTQVQQKSAIAAVVGDELANEYITKSQYLARGHLSAKTDYVFATGQRATFMFINAAPQWQPFNAGNWNWLEQNLRKRIAQAGYSTVIYTGTFGVTQLRNSDGRLVDVYLNGDTVPVPQYFYKVVYDESNRIGTAFVSINNPYYTTEEARDLQFCTDRCRNNDAFDWLRWQPDRIDIGYSFCCTVDDFRRHVPHLPEIIVNDLLT